MRSVLGPKGYQLHACETQEPFVSFDFLRHGTTNEVRFRRGNTLKCSGFFPQRQGQNLTLTVLIGHVGWTSAGRNSRT